MHYTVLEQQHITSSIKLPRLSSLVQACSTITHKIVEKMKSFKHLISKRGQKKTASLQGDDLVPHLVRRYSHDRKSNQASRPLPYKILIEKFDRSDVPNIVLWPPTPPPSGMKIEDLLFERSGSFFVLREKTERIEARSTRAVVGRLQVPARHKTEIRNYKDVWASRHDESALNETGTQNAH